MLNFQLIVEEDGSVLTWAYIHFNPLRSIDFIYSVLLAQRTLMLSRKNQQQHLVHREANSKLWIIPLHYCMADWAEGKWCCLFVWEFYWNPGCWLFNWLSRNNNWCCTRVPQMEGRGVTDASILFLLKCIIRVHPLRLAASAGVHATSHLLLSAPPAFTGPSQ